MSKNNFSVSGLLISLSEDFFFFFLLLENLLSFQLCSLVSQSQEEELRKECLHALANLAQANIPISVIPVAMQRVQEVSYFNLPFKQDPSPLTHCFQIG